MTELCTECYGGTEANKRTSNNQTLQKDILSSAHGCKGRISAHGCKGRISGGELYLTCVLKNMKDLGDKRGRESAMGRSNLVSMDVEV